MGEDDVSDSTQLERRYRRLLDYTRTHSAASTSRRCSALLAGPAEGQRRPSVDDAIDLVMNAIFMRLSHMFEQLFVKSYERRHPRLLWGFRIVWGLVLLGLPARRCPPAAGWHCCSGGGCSRLCLRLPHLPDRPKPASNVTRRRV